MSEFIAWPKIPRYSREVIITEKIDGTNAAVLIEPFDPSRTYANHTAIGRHDGQEYVVWSQSRTRFITPGNDNFGFATWVKKNVDDLCRLGIGAHHGEWWGVGIQRGYDMSERRFSLFNVTRWGTARPGCCHVVPLLYQGIMSEDMLEECVRLMAIEGSYAAPGYMNPEGVVMYHTAAHVAFKKTIKDDEAPKGTK